jgi:hypothetical protein
MFALSVYSVYCQELNPFFLLLIALLIALLVATHWLQSLTRRASFFYCSAKKRGKSEHVLQEKASFILLPGRKESDSRP